MCWGRGKIYKSKCQLKRKDLINTLEKVIITGINIFLVIYNNKIGSQSIWLGWRSFF